MRNTVVQRDGVSYINMGNWYIGIHYSHDGEVLIYADHDYGAVESFETPTEDGDQWGVRLSLRGYKDKTRRSSNITTLRRNVRVEVEE